MFALPVKLKTVLYNSCPISFLKKGNFFTDNDLRLRSEALLKFEGYNDVQITTLFLNWLPTVTSSATVKLQSK